MDLNNLIAAIITSTAALVAIIGGFLVSRVISISSEQNGIKRKLREINNELIAKREIKDNIEKYLFEDDLDDFVTQENIKRLVFEEKSLQEIIEEDDYTYLTQKQLEPYFEQLKSIVGEVLGKIESLDEISDSFIEFKHHSGDLEYPDREEWYERVFNTINKEIAKSQSTGIFGSLHNFDFSITRNAIAPNYEYRDKKKERSRLEDEVKVLELQMKAQSDLLINFGRPAWIWSGIAVLFYASIVGIIYPSTLLPYPVETYNDVRTKWFLLSLFYSQLLVLFIYLSYAMYKLTHSDDV